MVFLLYFRNAILAKNCADCKMTVNFHITTVVNEDFFPVTMWTTFTDILIGGGTGGGGRGQLPPHFQKGGALSPPPKSKPNDITS